jgi:hypothetical protein
VSRNPACASAVSAGIAALLLAATLLTESAASSSQAEAAGGRCSWQVDPHRPRAVLHGLTVVSRRNVWAVGGADVGNALALHWLGAGWDKVDVPIYSPGEFFAAAFAAANDGWGVGRRDSGLGADYAIDHWDGSRWTVVPSAHLGGRGVVLLDVAALGPNDAWAVGLDTPAPGVGKGRTLTEHWDGVHWEAVATPDVGQSELAALDAVTHDNVWAVGNHLGSTLIEHWDGRRWKAIPNPAARRGTLVDIDGVSADDIWAVGWYGSEPNTRPLLEHWNGANWRRIDSPVRRGFLAGVAVPSTRNVWVAGGHDISREFVAHRLGAKWRTARPPHFKKQQITTIAAAGNNDIWATGLIWNSGNYTSLIEHVRC